MLYLKLFHGRKTLEEDMDDWGKDGPVFGPLSFVHTTYAGVVHLGSPDVPWDTIGDLFIHGACIYYDGMFYGDWSVFGEEVINAELRGRHVPFDQGKANIDHEPPGV